MASKSPNPSELRMILARNLQKLARETASISEMCRKIGVNRTQFNRYLAGSAFPRPDVLHRICTYFKVDANILLRDLDATESETEEPQFDPWRFITHRPFDHYLLPDGLYQYWRKSFRQPQRAYQGMARITTEGTAKIWKGYDLHDQAIRPGGRRFSRSTQYNGILIQQFDGFALISRTPYSDVMNMTYFEYGLEGLQDYYTGIAFVTRRRLPDTNRVTGIIMQRLPLNCATILACARGCGSKEMTELPPMIQRELSRVPDRI